MSAPLRVKIEYRNGLEEDGSSLKFVYLIVSPATTAISTLISNLQDLMTTQFSRQNVHLVHLTTDDGYLLMKNNMCQNILIHNEKLICVDMNQFVYETINTLNPEEAWLKLEHHDTTDDLDKSLIVGINTTGQFYIYLFGGGSENKTQLYLFNMIELLAIMRDEHKDGSQLQMKIPRTSSSEWFVEVKWEHDSTSNSTLLLIGNLKASDMTQIQTGRLRIYLNELSKTIDKWEVVDSSHAQKDNRYNDEQEQARLNQLRELIPPPKRTGPRITTEIPSIKIEIHECEGDSALRMMQGSESSVAMTQDLNARNGTFRNQLNVTHIIISKKPIVLPEILTHKRSVPADRPIPIVRVNVQYQQHDGKWVDCQNPKIVLASTQDNDNPKLATSILNIEPDKVVSVSIQAAIEIKGKPNRTFTTQRRAHRSLPQPLKLKIILTDNLSKTCSLTVEQINEPLRLITRENFLKQEQEKVKKLITFVDMDDCEFEERIFIAVYIDSDDRLTVARDSRRFQMSKSEMRTMQRNAKKNKTTEQSIDLSNASTTKVMSLFDQETYLLYAIRIELTTTTSQAVETVLLPLDEIK